MYRQALATAAAARGWKVRWYDRDTVIGGKDKHLSAIGKSIGPPWQAIHKLAAAAALAAAGS